MHLALVSTSLLALGTNFVVRHVVNVDFVARLDVHTALAPVVARGIRKHVTLGIEGRTGDGSLRLSKTLESLLVVLVPEIDNSVLEGKEGTIAIVAMGKTDTLCVSCQHTEPRVERQSNRHDIHDTEHTKKHLPIPP